MTMRVFKSLLILGSALCAMPSMATDFTFSGPVTIPSGPGNASVSPIQFAVSGLNSVSDLSLTISNLSHTFPDDIQIVLQAPDGTAAYVLANAGANNDLNDVTLTFDQQSNGGIAPDTTGYGSGTYRPSFYGNPYSPGFAVDAHNTLNVFNGVNPNGTWNLYVMDDVAGDAGSFDGATLSISDAAAVAPVVTTSSTNSNPVSIPDVGIATPESFNFSGLGEITDVNVTVTGLSHTFPADLHIVLRGPDGTAVYLLANAGASNDLNNVTLTFDQQAALRILADDTIGSGTYVSSLFGNTASFGFPVDFGNSLNIFNGMSADGIWDLFVLDDLAGDRGGFSSATLTLTTKAPVGSAVPEPATWAMMIGGFAFAGTAMRRRKASIAFA